VLALLATACRSCPAPTSSAPPRDDDRHQLVVVLESVGTSDLGPHGEDPLLRGVFALEAAHISCHAMGSRASVLFVERQDFARARDLLKRDPVCRPGVYDEPYDPSAPIPVDHFGGATGPR